MDADKIIQDLNRRFAAPLPEFYKRRIVVWIDEDGEFADKLDDITVNGAKVVALTGSNNFYVKLTVSGTNVPRCRRPRCRRGALPLPRTWWIAELRPDLSEICP